MAKTRKSPPHKSGSPYLSGDDELVWYAVTQSVKPLKGREKLKNPLGDKPVKLAPTPKYAVPTETSQAHVRPLPELSHGAGPGLDKATAKRMRRGQMQIEGRIDLHGMSQTQAHRALEAFIEASWHAGRREVLVITGKGTQRDGSIGVLRQQVPRWLNDSPNRARVVAFSHAAPKDGGEGALYIRLKRRGR